MWAICRHRFEAEHGRASCLEGRETSSAAESDFAHDAAGDSDPKFLEPALESAHFATPDGGIVVSASGWIVIIIMIGRRLLAPNPRAALRTGQPTRVRAGPRDLRVTWKRAAHEGANLLARP